ncbi:hypothetical protein ACSBR2_005448 [Camellia fascicularis]
MVPLFVFSFCNLGWVSRFLWFTLPSSASLLRMENLSFNQETMDRLDLCEGTGKNEDISDLCLIGKILVSKTLNKQAVYNILRSAWRPRAALEISL